MAVVTAEGSVALSGSPQTIQLAVAPSLHALALSEVLLTTPGSSGLAVIQDQNSNVGFEAELVTNVPLSQSGLGYHFQPGAIVSLVVPAGSGTWYYTITFELA